MPYSRPYAGGFVDFPSTTTPINSTALNTMDVGIKTANDQFQTVTTAQRNALVPTVGQAVWDSDLRQLMVYMNASGGNAWQAVGNTIICTSTTRPATPFHGQMIYETDTKREWRYDGTRWVQTNSASTTSGVTGVNNLIVPPLLRVRRATTQSINNATDTFITWTIEDFDTDNCFTASSDTVTVQTSGVYVVTAGVSFAANATGYRRMDVFKSPVSASDYATSLFSVQIPVNSGTADAFLMGSSVQTFTAGDTIKVSVAQNSGGALNAGNSTFTSINHLSFAWIGRTS